MKTVVVYLLLLATLLPSISPWGTIAYYHANKDYIAKVLCENRDKPQLHCDGKCYLAKRLKAQQDKQDKETTQRVQKAPSCQLFCADYTTLSIPAPHLAQQPKPVFGFVVGTYGITLTPPLHPPARLS